MSQSAGVLDLGRKPKKKPTAPPVPDDVPNQFNIRINDDELARRIHETCKSLGLDGANFLRQMIRETLPIYEKRAQAVRDRKPPE